MTTQMIVSSWKLSSRHLSTDSATTWGPSGIGITSGTGYYTSVCRPLWTPRFWQTSTISLCISSSGSSGSSSVRPLSWTTPTPGCISSPVWLCRSTSLCWTSAISWLRSIACSGISRILINCKASSALVGYPSLWTLSLPPKCLIRIAWHHCSRTSVVFSVQCSVNFIQRLLHDLNLNCKQ